MKLLTAAAALALFATPVLAQTAAPTVGNNNSQAQAAGEMNSTQGSGQPAGVMSDANNQPGGSIPTDGMSTSSTGSMSSTANPAVVPNPGVPSTGASTAASGTPGATTDENTTPSGGVVPGQTPN